MLFLHNLRKKVNYFVLFIIGINSSFLEMSDLFGLNVKIKVSEKDISQGDVYFK